MVTADIDIAPSTAVLLGLGFFLAVLGLLRRRRSLKHIRGPPTASRLIGHEYDLNRQTEVGDLEFKWLREYGPTWKISGLLGTDGLMTADPKVRDLSTGCGTLLTTECGYYQALQHVFQKANGIYLKKNSQNHIGWLMAGPNIAWSQGEAHTRHRRIMSPAFSNARLKSFLPLFQRIGGKLTEKWKGELLNVNEVELSVDTWLSRATLDVIGEAAFDYDYGALDDGDQSVLAKEYHGIFKDTDYMLPKATLFFRGSWDYLPLPILKMFRYIPVAPFTRLRHLNNVFTAYGKQILREKVPEFDAEKSAKSKDIMSILIKANASSDAKMRLSDEELLAEMFALTLAGHETTSMALTFLLYELARHPEYQTRLRKDIREARARVNARGESDFTLEDFDSIPTLINAIKACRSSSRPADQVLNVVPSFQESLRVHPTAVLLPRVATKDDVIPLAYPITSTTGEVITEVPVSKGHVIVASFASYQRLPEVWGEDADVWNPDRFSRIDIGKQTNVGVFANLLAFSAGTNACIGWRFSIIEQQAFVAELIDSFQFSLPAGSSPEKTEVVCAPSGTAMVPVIRGKPELGSGLRLRISFAPA
ncbi:PAH-inducible cytochrome P450 monooxygenase PC-PAH 4 [Trametes meyenii]|nr:PAH-inducible cytochrome P450 monooxygenase PC-PAH 4 [Trametes meyenii]